MNRFVTVEREPYPVTPMSSRSLLASALVVLASVAGCSRTEHRAQHVVLITVDTLRSDRLGCYGGKNPCSPAIDQLAKEGTLFTAAYVPRAVTLSSMTTFFTSKYPSEHGVINNMQRVGPEEVLLAERLKNAGFHNRAWSASAVLKPASSGIDQGFDSQMFTEELNEVAMAQAAAKYLREKFARDNRREFLWVHFMNPHRPYDPPPPYDRKFDASYAGDIDGATTTLDRLYIEKPELAPADLQHVLALYDGQVAFIDKCIGDLLKALDDSGKAADTLVVFAADHGEELFTHNMYPYHSNTPYRSGTRIPLIFRQKDKVRAGVVSNELVESVDLVPTLCGWLGVDPTATKGPDATVRGLDIGETLANGDAVKRSFAHSQVDEDIFVVRNQEWSLISNPDEICPDGPPEQGEYRVPKLGLYHLPDDPDELTNVADAHPDVVEKLSRALDAWHAGLKAHRAEKNPNMQWAREMEQQGYLSGAKSGVTARPNRSGQISPPASSPARHRKNQPKSQERQADDEGG